MSTDVNTETKTETKTEGPKTSPTKLKEIKEQLLDGVGLVPISGPGSYDPITQQFIPKSFLVQKMTDIPGVNNQVNIRILYPKNNAAGNPDPKLGFIAQDSKMSTDLEVGLVFGRAKQSIIKCFNDLLLENMRNYIAEYNTTRMVGADPEIFIEDGKGNIIPAFEFLPDKKHKVVSTVFEDYGHSNRNSTGIYWDGWQAEFETKADTCNERHVDSIHSGLKQLYKLAKKHKADAKLSLKNTIEVPLETLQASKEEHVAFGCAPSFNIYGLKTPPLDGRTTQFRSAGGHLHFGIGKKSEATIEEVVKTLDAIIGVACVSLFAGMDNPKRREYYGLAGEFRTPPHGIEWRVLSNAWLCHPAIAHLVIDPARNTVAFALNNLRHLWKASEEEVIETINSCDVRQAKRIIRRNKDIFMAILKVSYPEDYKVLLAYETYLYGVESIIADPADFVNNWDLERTWNTGSNGVHKKWCQVAAYIKDNPGAKV